MDEEILIEYDDRGHNPLVSKHFYENWVMVYTSVSLKDRDWSHIDGLISATKIDKYTWDFRIHTKFHVVEDVINHWVDLQTKVGDYRDRKFKVYRKI